MKEIIVTQQQLNKQNKIPPGSILYFIRLLLISLGTLAVAIEPHTFQGHGYSVVDYTLLFIPFFLYIIAMIFLFNRSKPFFYITHMIFGYNLILLILTFTPYFIEENHILPFLCAFDFLMVLYLHKSARAAMFYKYRNVLVIEEEER